jgi:hypothetical protein
MRTLTAVILLIALVAGLSLVGFVSYAMLARFKLAGEVNPGSLAVSVGRASDSPGEMLGALGECKRIRPGVWRCSEVDGEGSGSAVYRVRMRGNGSCWDARLLRGALMDEHVSGCVHRWQWSLLS